MEEISVVAEVKTDVDAPLYDQTYSVLRNMIESGQIQPGDLLLEAQVVKAFGVSRSPARRALEALSRDKLIVAHDKRGYRVAGADLSETATRLAPLSTTPISQPRQWERMFSEVEQQLLASILFSSVRINDQRLAEQYDVSRTVTRDLLARMHAMGFISKDRQSHWIAPRMTTERIKYLYELRALLEPEALRQSADRVPQRFILQARKHIDTMRKAAKISSEEFDRAEADLHIEILSFAPNTELLHALRRTHVLFAPTRHLFDPLLGIPIPMIEDALNEHSAILDLLLKNKVDAAAADLKAHLTDAVSRWVARLEGASPKNQLPMPPYLTRVAE